ncbi:hypothetical protein [Erythrobacter dokdonensis]|uniref:Uncharacterized protein n=1 Tax=Erythrobacter dokdonensis DSW-74 TaxID=1300349 RepID=A0A1A7BI17_9SPHN|nr:hypothetical protein [Erythrobacter dokdonensis]OBV11356.1 hypothetical protein I603_1764 [Erythrobacter dokdonensis DSW-74]
MIDFTLATMTVLFVLALLGAETLGRSIATRMPTEDALGSLSHDRIGHILTSIFGLLALLVGFSFSMALDRYETRRSDVVAEANALGTAHYRASFLGETTSDLQRAIEDYTRHRTTYGSAIETGRDALEAQAQQLRPARASSRLRTRRLAHRPSLASTRSSISACSVRPICAQNCRGRCSPF